MYVRYTYMPSGDPKRSLWSKETQRQCLQIHQLLTAFARNIVVAVTVVNKGTWDAIDCVIPDRRNKVQAGTNMLALAALGESM